LRELHAAIDHLGKSTERLANLREDDKLEWRDAMGYLGVQIGRWLTREDRYVLEDPGGDLSNPECELLKSWAHDLKKTLSTIKGLLREAGGKSAKRGT
jgi:hypothetical protein